MATLATYERAVLSWVAEDSYPMNVEIPIDVRMAEKSIRFSEPAGFNIQAGAVVAITGSRIATLLDGGFEGRKHVTVWGVAAAKPRARFAVSPVKTWIWDEDDLPLPAAYERDLPKARRYFDALSGERTEPVRPKPPSGLVAFRVLHAPFLGATFAPILLGLAVAARRDIFDPFSASLLVAAVGSLHVGLNIGGGLFDAMRGIEPISMPATDSGAGSAGATPLSAIRGAAPAAVVCCGISVVLGAALLALRFSPALAVAALIALVIGLAYGQPFVRLAHRGFDEVATAIVFGPLLLLGAYLIQSGGALSLEAAVLSVPVGLLAALVLYVNEIRRKESDEKAGRRTLPVRWSKSAVVAGYRLTVLVAFAALVAGVGVGLLPLPALLVLLLAPLVIRINSGLANANDEPHGQWGTAAASTLLHANFSALLLLAYIFAVADIVLLNLKPYLW
jgi:1,4-dihydroxy-2-naphthoate octaprenyltransferase